MLEMLQVIKSHLSVVLTLEIKSKCLPQSFGDLWQRWNIYSFLQLLAKIDQHAVANFLPTKTLPPQREFSTPQ